ncbi:MAG: serine hydrolase domain-containing protein [Planctomycetota bacterium]
MDALPRTQQLIIKGIDQGLHPGAQVSVWHRGESVTDLAYGEAQPGVAITPETLTLWLSSCKPITAVALAKQVEAGVVHLDEPVAEYVNGFEQNGKQGITLRHVLTHTGGFRSVVFRYPEQPWEDAIETVCKARLETGWEPGATAGYHPHSGWNILGRVLEVCTGQPLSQHLRESVLLPLGLDESYVGTPDEAYEELRPRLSAMIDTGKTVPVDPGFHEKTWVTGQRPGGNAYGPARQLARFYQALLDITAGRASGSDALLQPATLADFTARHRCDTMDRTFRAVMDWGLGFMVNNRRHDAVNAEKHGPTGTPYGFGPHASDEAFGHCGNQSSAAFADPSHDLVAVVIFNGMPGEPKHQQRMYAVLGAIYEDLGLATTG